MVDQAEKITQMQRDIFYPFHLLVNAKMRSLCQTGTGA